MGVCVCLSVCMLVCLSVCVLNQKGHAWLCLLACVFEIGAATVTLWWTFEKYLFVTSLTADYS